MLFAKLPPELITNITSHLISDGAATGTPFFSWITATQICAYWRSIAFGCPALWTNMSTTNMSWSKAFVERSRGQPLRIDTSPGPSTDEKYDAMFRLLVENMHRIRVLNLGWKCNTERLRQLQGVPALQLETLKCNVKEETIDAQASPPEPAVMPVLQQLEISYNLTQTLSSLLPDGLSTVTRLTLRSLSPGRQIDVIKRCPVVRHLVIEDRPQDDIPLDQFEHPIPTLVILPDLQVYLPSRRLSLHVLSKLTLPSILKFDIEFRFDCSKFNTSHSLPQQFPVLTTTLEPFISPMLPVIHSLSKNLFNQRGRRLLPLESA